MSIISYQIGTTGEVGANPRRCPFVVTDNLATVTTAGYLNNNALNPNQLIPTDIIDMIYSYSASTNSGTYGEFTVAISAGIISLSLNVDAGNVLLPVTANHIAGFNGTSGQIYSPTTASPQTLINNGSLQAGADAVAGTLISYPATTANGSFVISALNAGAAFTTTLRNSVMGQSTVYSIPDAGAATAKMIISSFATTQNITAGALQVNAGAISSGLATGGFVGNIIAYPTTTTAGSLVLAAVSNGTGNFSTTISNASAVAQSQVITIPDAGAATASFLLSTGAANIIAYQEIVSLNEILIASVGTWTMTRVAQANYALVHTPADDTSVIGIDITPQIRVAASKGFRLDSFDLVYSIGVAALDAHSATLDQVSYANNVAVAVTSVTMTATLSTATQSNPYVTNCTITTPAFLVTADSKYVLELTVNAAATSTYSLYGLNLRFSQTIA